MALAGLVARHLVTADGHHPGIGWVVSSEVAAEPLVGSCLLPRTFGCLSNGVLLCRMHHTLIHQSGWEVFIGHDGHPWFLEPIDPARPDRPRVPIRSHARRTMTVHAAAA